VCYFIVRYFIQFLLLLTLINPIGEIEADEGRLKIKNGIKISYLEQTPPQDNHKNLFDIVAEGLGDIGYLLRWLH
jgi:ATP-binding cassette subfamily F protein uup